MIALLRILAIFWFGSMVKSSFIIPNMRNDVYYRDGDLILGAIFRVHRFSSSSICSTKIQSQKQFQYHEAMVYSVSVVNKDQSILPNTTLGFAILDDCTSDQASMARVMSYVPPAPCCNCKSNSSAPYYNVVGVVSGTNSGNTITAAALLNVFRIPMVGTTTTSELLSDKVKYNNFLRVVPSDKFQAQVIIDILLHYNWSYISAINSPGGYGEIGIKAVKAAAEANGICIAYSREIDVAKDAEEEFDQVVKNLVRFSNARAVVMFVQGSHGRGVVAAAHRAGYRDHFIWITSDSVGPSNDFAGIEETGAGGFHVQLFSTIAPGFPEYFENLSPTTSDNPWISELWQSAFNCNPDGTNGFEKCNGTKTMKDVAGYSPYSKTALFADSVKTFAYALHAYIIDKCPNAFGKRDLLRACVIPSELRPYLYKVTFEGSYGTVKFDELGDADGKYAIQQLQKVGGEYVLRNLGFWNKATYSLYLNEETYWNTKPAEDGSVSVPESLCSKPCKMGEFYVQLELKCCWNCRQCRNNEITINNASSCEECPLFAWPESETFTECIPIPPTYLNWIEIFPGTCLIIATVGILVSAGVFVVYIINRGSKLIKATSRELSLIALIGNLLSYVAAIAVATKPIPLTCYLGRLGFTISICVVYASLLAKTSRIYRIFQSAKKGTQKPMFTSSKSQLIIVIIMIIIQIVISSVTTVLAPPDVTTRMPVRTEKYAELLCDLPMNGFVPSLSYNLLLILSCSLYAFKARKLPDNFNESKYIFFAVCTTIFLWVAFLPTYFSAFYATQKALLLSTMLLMNATVILLTLYIPKVYALYYVDDEAMQLQNTGSVIGGTKVGPSTTTTTEDTTAPTEVVPQAT